jgi:excisionase family DNA binding protein
MGQPEARRLPKLLTLRAIEEQTTIPRPTLYTLVARRELPAVRVGRSVRVDERDLMAYIAAHKD